MNDIIFSNSFFFRTFSMDKFNYTDNRCGSPSHYFAYMISGVCKIVTETETVEINEGDIFYIPDKVSYQSYWYGNPEIKFISLGFLYMPNTDNKSYSVQVIPQGKETDGAIKLFHLIAGSKTLCAEDIGRFYTLCALLIPSMTHSICRTKEIVNQTKKYLINHPFATVKELAKNCAVSEAALYSAFQKSSDITLNELRNRLLLEKAKDLLISTDKSVEYISDLLGFSSTSYFRKKFKSYFNVTPREMRKKYRI